MRRLFLAAVAFLALTAIAPKAHAQGGGGARGRMEMLFKDITLSDAQRAKVDSVVGYYREQLQQLGGRDNPDSAAMVKRREVMTKQNADLRTLLNPEQQKVFDKNVAEMRDRMGRRPPGK